MPNCRLQLRAAALADEVSVPIPHMFLALVTLLEHQGWPQIPSVPRGSPRTLTAASQEEARPAGQASRRSVEILSKTYEGRGVSSPRLPLGRSPRGTHITADVAAPRKGDARPAGQAWRRSAEIPTEGGWGAPGPQLPLGQSPQGTHVSADVAAQRQGDVGPAGQRWRRSVEISREGGFRASSLRQLLRGALQGTHISADAAAPRPATAPKQPPASESRVTLVENPPTSPPALTTGGASGLCQLPKLAVLAENERRVTSRQALITPSVEGALSSGSDTPQTVEGWLWWEKPEALSACSPAASPTGSDGTCGPLIGWIDLQTRTRVFTHISGDGHPPSKRLIGGEAGPWGTVPYSPGASHVVNRVRPTAAAVTSTSHASQSSHVHGHVEPLSHSLEQVSPNGPPLGTLTSPRSPHPLPTLESSTSPAQARVPTGEVTCEHGSRRMRSVDVGRQPPSLRSGRYSISRSELFKGLPGQHNVLQSGRYGLSRSDLFEDGSKGQNDVKSVRSPVSRKGLLGGHSEQPPASHAGGYPSHKIQAAQQQPIRAGVGVCPSEQILGNGHWRNMCPK